MIRPISKAAYIKYYATVSADTDLITESAALVTPLAGRPCEWIIAGTAGDITIKTSGGTTAQVYLAAGVPLYIDAVTLFTSGASAAKLTVGW